MFVLAIDTDKENDKDTCEYIDKNKYIHRDNKDRNRERGRDRDRDRDRDGDKDKDRNRDRDKDGYRDRRNE